MDLPLTQALQKVKLWGFPGSGWADSTCTEKLIYVVIHREKNHSHVKYAGRISTPCPHRWQGRGRAALLAPWAAGRVSVGTGIGTSTWLLVWKIQQESHYGTIVDIFSPLVTAF